jgi:hypothetical protein
MSTKPTSDPDADQERARFELRLERWDSRPGRWRTPHSAPPPAPLETAVEERLRYVRLARAALRRGQAPPADAPVARSGKNAVSWLILGFVSLGIAIWLLV